MSEPKAIRRIELKAFTKKGDRFAFDLHVRDAVIPLHCSTTDAGKMVKRLIHFSQQAYDLWSDTDKESARAPATVTDMPLSAVSFGIAQGRTPEETIVAVDVGPMVLSFSILTNELQTLRAYLDRAEFAPGTLAH